MSDETMVMEREEEVIGQPMDDPKELARKARELVPVQGSGISPANLAQLVDFARDMAKARFSIPEHFQGNVGDCLAVIDIATRASLSPYMVAQMTYLDPGSKRIAFMSQLFHALAYGWMIGEFEVSYEGEGGDRVCIVTGTLKTDPNRPKVHRSPPLRDLHPGYTLKRNHSDGGTGKTTLTYAEGQELKQKAAGASIKEGELFSRGSPLWDRKPDVQQFYDTSRDWVRIFCPRATLGIYTPDDHADYPIKDVTPAGSEAGLHQRLVHGEPSREEGHADGHVDSELDQIAPNRGGSKPKASNKKEKKESAPAPSAKQIDAVAEPGEVSTVKAAEEKLKETAAPAASIWPEGKKPKDGDEYATYARAWLFTTKDADEIEARWAKERKLRNACGLTAEDRKPLEEDVKARANELRGGGE